MVPAFYSCREQGSVLCSGTDNQLPPTSPPPRLDKCGPLFRSCFQISAICRKNEIQLERTRQQIVVFHTTGGPCTAGTLSHTAILNSLFEHCKLRLYSIFYWAQYWVGIIYIMLVLHCIDTLRLTASTLDLRWLSKSCANASTVV